MTKKYRCKQIDYAVFVEKPDRDVYPKEDDLEKAVEAVVESLDLGNHGPCSTWVGDSDPESDYYCEVGIEYNPHTVSLERTHFEIEAVRKALTEQLPNLAFEMKFWLWLTGDTVDEGDAIADWTNGRLEFQGQPLDINDVEFIDYEN